MTRSSHTVPVVIMSGYLGAGKTTFLNQVLANTSQRIVVLMNDFGSINIDAALISTQHGDTIELTNGCVCCAIGDSLADAMLDISDRLEQPDMVIIEASGVADPAAVAAYAHLGGFHLAAILTFIDAENALSTSTNTLVSDTFWRQINSADLGIITKTDIVESALAERVYDSILRQRPDLHIISPQAFDPAALIDMTSTFDMSSLEQQSTDTFHSTVITTPHLEDADELLTFLEDLPSNIIRIKGVVGLPTGHVEVHRVGSRVSISPTNLPTTGLVTITAD